MKNAGSKSSWTASSTSIRMPAAPPSLSSTPPRLLVGRSAPTRKVSKRREFEKVAIPWDNLAFRSTEEGLRDYLAGLLHPVKP